MLYLENTATYGRLSRGVPYTDNPVRLPPGSDGGEGGFFDEDATPLVIRCISQRSFPESFLVYPDALGIVRTSSVQKTDITPPERTEIQGFSDHSRRRLRFLAGNPSSALISQFCMTYHKAKPDGRTVKKHLNSWLTALRRRFPDIHYLWVLEFQTRGVPHFHIWLSLPHNLPGLHNILAKSWNRIAEPDSPEHLAFHLHAKNFIPWDMRSPGYLCKYLDKESQKAIPQGFTGCGRFWGNSRGLLAIPEEITADDLQHLDTEEIDEETGEITTRPAATKLLRAVGKLHEKKLARTPWRSRARKGSTSYTLHGFAPAFRQYLGWLRREFERREGVPF